MKISVIKKHTKTNGKKANRQYAPSTVLPLMDCNAKFYLEEIESQWDTALPGSPLGKQPGQTVGKPHPFAAN